jgi:hypothetical protein
MKNLEIFDSGQNVWSTNPLSQSQTSDGYTPFSEDRKARRSETLNYRSMGEG